MKEIVKSIFLLVVIYLLLFFLVNTNRKSQVTTDKQSQPETKTITVTETLTQVIYDTLFIDHFETVKLPVVDTLILINDSIRVDSVFVEVPISVYKFDNTFTTDTTCMNIRIQTSGFDVKLDTLSYSFTYRPTKTKTNFFRDHFRFGVGIGTGYGCFSKQPDVFLGIGVYYCF